MSAPATRTGAFVTPLRVEFRPRGYVELLAPLVWRDDDGDVVAPATFASDGGTIPAICWLLVGHPLSGSLVREFILHDLELQLGTPRAVADRRLRDRLAATGKGRVRRGLIYAGVRARAYWVALTT